MGGYFNLNKCLERLKLYLRRQMLLLGTEGQSGDLNVTWEKESLR